jgi:hypothetical protein
MDGQFQPKTELSIELKRAKPEQGCDLIATSPQPPNIREIRGKSCFRG